MEEKSYRKFHYFLLWFCIYPLFKLSIPSRGFYYGWSFCYPPCCGSTASSQNSRETTTGSFLKGVLQLPSSWWKVCRVIIQSVLPVYENITCLRHLKYFTQFHLMLIMVSQTLCHTSTKYDDYLSTRNISILLLYYANIKTGQKLRYVSFDSVLT